MKLLFGEDLSTEDGDGELSFDEYLKAIGARSRKQLTLKDAGGDPVKKTIKKK